MNKISRSLYALAALALLPLSLYAAGGSAPPQTNPEDEAAAAYKRGLEHRDKAWKLEEERDGATDEKQRAKLDNKIGKEYDKAIRAFQSATGSDPKMHQAYSSLGYALRKAGRFEESLAAYNQALELQPDYAEAIEYRAEAYLGLNRLDEVKEAYMQLFRDDRERADELMAAMENWVVQRREDSAGLDSASVEAFAGWVEERKKVAGSTARLDSESDRTW